MLIHLQYLNYLLIQQRDSKHIFFKFRLHHMIIKTRFAAAAILLMVAFGCSQNAENGSTADSTATDSVLAGNLETETQVQDFVQSLPSPIHIAKIFQRAGLKYISGLTNPAGNASKYLSPYSQSINLGVYTTDLSYCTFNNQSQESITYFKAVKTMTDKLNLTSIFESTQLLPRFEKNIGNTDSMVTLMALMSMESDFLLKQTSRMDIAYLSFAGAWIESTYIATQMLKNKRNPDILNKLLDQSHSLGKLIKLLDSYKDKEDFAGLIAGLSDVKASLDVLNSENTITHEEEFKKLVEKVEKLRNEVVNDN